MKRISSLVLFFALCTITFATNGIFRLTSPNDVGFVLVEVPNTSYNYQCDKWRGDDYISKDGTFSTQSIPDNYPFIEGTPSMNVLVDGKAYVGLYNDKNYWGGNVQFGSFECKNGHRPRITVITSFDVNKAEVLPHSAKVSKVEVQQRSISFTIDSTQQYITLILNDDYKGDVLHLFCNTMKQPPKLSKKYNKQTHYDPLTSMYYFEAGYWNLADLGFDNNTITLQEHQQVYIAPGAVVNGRIHVTNSDVGDKQVHVFGTGMIVNNEATKQNSLLVDYTEAGTIEDVLVHTHRSHCWQTIYSNCKNVNVRNMKIVGTRYASTDGIDVIACENCTFDNVFVRSSDDCVAIKGLGEDLPANSPIQENLSFNNMQLWNDCNNAFGIGAETHAKYMRNISLTNSEVLFSYDDPEFHERLDERSALNICCLNGTYISNILFDNIYVNRCERLIGMGFKDCFWFGTLKGDQSTEGGISSITFRNINSPNSSTSSIANEIWLYGWYQPNTPTKTITDVTFQNVNIQGERVMSKANKNIRTNNKAVSKQLVYDLHFAK